MVLNPGSSSVEGRPLFAAGGLLQPLDAAPRLRFALSEVEIGAEVRLPPAETAA